MMHFSIPDTKEFVNKNNGSTYTAYNIHINGSFHCYLRFKQLHSLNEQLKRSLSSLTLPPFPPKLLLPPTPNQLEQRRAKLERYIQLIGQDPVISKSELLRTFLLRAQQESAYIDSREVTLDVYLMNGYRIAVNAYTTDCSSNVLEKSCQSIDITKELIYYFSLFLMRKNSDGSIALIRKLGNFESPYITQKISDDCKIVIRKSYWDSNYDLDLMKDRITLNLLYIQAVSDVERGWILSTTDDREQLSNLQARGNKKEYLEIVRKLPYYGCLQFSHAIVDYPEPSMIAIVSIGNREISIRTNLGNKIQETKYKVTRMRCWRVSTIHHNGGDGSSNSSNEGQNYTYELSFEYLLAKNCLKWITINSDQAMLLSVCLQGIVDELLNQKSGNGIQNATMERASFSKLTYIRRDDSNNETLSRSNSCEPISFNESEFSAISASNNQQNNQNSSFRSKFKDKFSTAVSFRVDKESVRNEAFEVIGDEDL